MEKFTILFEKIEKAEETAEQILNREWSSNTEGPYEFYYKMREEGFDKHILKEFIEKNII